MRAPHVLVVAAVVALLGCDSSGGLSFCAVAIDGSPVRGRDDALVTIVEFADYQCPYCRDQASTLVDVERDHGEDLRVVFKHMPLEYHERAMPAAVAAECAHEQGLFWEVHELLNDADHVALDEVALVDAATAAGVELEDWRECRLGTAAADRVEADRQLGIDIGIPATPTLLVNGSPLVGSHSAEEIADAIDSALADALASGLEREAYYDSLTDLACE